MQCRDMAQNKKIYVDVFRLYGGTRELLSGAILEATITVVDENDRSVSAALKLKGKIGQFAQKGEPESAGRAIPPYRHEIKL
jgi:hypothetical protein